MSRFVDRVLDVAFHRNGVGGEPFHVVLFESDGCEMVATVFEARGTVAVLSVDRLAAGDAGSSDAKFRGDRFEYELRKVVRAWDAESETRTRALVEEIVKGGAK